MRPIIICKKCNCSKEHYARDLCRQCYRYEPDQRLKEKLFSTNYRKNNRNLLKEKEKIRRTVNHDFVVNSVKRYNKFNKDKVNEYRRKRYKEDPCYKILCLTRGRFMKKIMKMKIAGFNPKKLSTLEFLGSDLVTIKNHLESLFLPGMTWDNHGTWQIDHILPCASFDLSKEEELKKCFYYKNLQPLWAKDNLLKGAKLDYVIINCKTIEQA
jgi:hypothetical protein